MVMFRKKDRGNIEGSKLSSSDESVLIKKDKNEKDITPEATRESTIAYKEHERFWEGMK